MCEERLQREKKSNILTNFLESEVFVELIKKRESTMFNTYLEAYLLCSIRIMSLRSEYVMEILVQRVCFGKTIWIWFKFY